MGHSVLLASNYNVWRDPFNSQCQSLVSVASGIESAESLTPEGSSYVFDRRFSQSVGYSVAEITRRCLSQAQMENSLSELPDT